MSKTIQLPVSLVTYIKHLDIYKESINLIYIYIITALYIVIVYIQEHVNFNN